MARPRRSLFRRAGPFEVVSQVGGKLEIRPSYVECIPTECREAVQGEVDQGRNYCPRCDCNHIFGFMGRMALAADIEEMLNRLARPRKKRA